MSDSTANKSHTLSSTPSNLAASSISGVRWNYFGGIGSTICSVIIGIVLARILGPKPYGQVIIATIIYGFINLFVDGGFGQALIQKPSIDNIDIRKTFTCQVGIGLSMTAMVFALAPLFARMFHDPSAVHVIQAMSLMMTIQSTGLVSAALLRRTMKFKVVQYSRLSSYLFGFLLVGIPLALHGDGVWSLVIAYLSQCLMNSVLLYWSVRHSVIPIFGLPDRSITSFGSTIIANNVANWGHSNIDNIAASHLGPVALGLYGRACDFAYQPVNTVVNGLQAVLLSSTARVQERKKLMHDLTLSLISIVFGLLGAAYATFALIPDTTIIGLYGDKWVGVIPLMIPFAIAMPFYGVHCLLGPILCGLGRPELEFWPQAISCAVAVIAYFAAARVSLVCLAWALLGIMLLRFGMIAGFAFRLLGVSWLRATVLIAERAGFSIAFGSLIWAIDRLLRIFSIGAGLRLPVLVTLSIALFGWAIWSAGNIVFGRHAVSFLLNYSSHLPAPYVRRLRMQADLSASPAAIG
jgi:PST family polysaccharide transporter